MIIIENLDHISFSVTDIEKSIDFYRDILGFDVIEKQSGSSEALIQVGDVIIRLCQVDNIDEKSNSESYVCFYVDEDDFDDALDEISENEIKVIYGPENIRKGRKVIISDPDENLIGLCYTK